MTHSILRTIIHRNGKPGFLLFRFFTEVMDVLYFSGVYVGRISRTKKKKKKKPGFPFEGLFIINIVSKMTPQYTACIERGMANLPLWQ